MLQHIGEVRVRHEEDGQYIVKVLINDYPDRTEANLLIDKKELKSIGIKSFKAAQRELPNLKNVILEQLNRQYPRFWEVDC